MYLQSIKSVNHNAAKSVNRKIFKKSRHVRFGVFIVHFVHDGIPTGGEEREREEDEVRDREEGGQKQGSSLDDNDRRKSHESLRRVNEA